MSPKLLNVAAYSNSYLYKYYAGYSDTFVASQINQIPTLKNDSIVLDPWNGSGTTTLVASILGLKSYGLDINPVMIIVAKSKMYYPEKHEADELFRIIEMNKRKRKRKLICITDPLLSWFDLNTVMSIRELELCIRCLCGYQDESYMKHFIDVDCVSLKLSFYYVALFELLREYTSRFVASNPTWVKTATNENERIVKSYTQICEEYLCLVCILESLLNNNIDNSKSTIQLGDSKKIQLHDSSVDCVITSPPYCTRIDYAIYTRVELALMGYNENEFDYIRRSMIGTPTINRRTENEWYHCQIWGSVLNDIQAHDSKAAESYYYKTYCQYSYAIERSLSEIYRVLKAGATVTLVLQDSWFKDIHIDVPNLVCQSLEARMCDLISFKSERVVSNMRYINTKSKLYGNNCNHEVVLTMKKRGI